MTRAKRDPSNGDLLVTWGKRVAAIGLIVGTLYASWAWLHVEFVPAADFSQKFQSVEKELKQSRYDSLRREEFEWLKEMRQRRLSDPEIKRMREIQQSIRQLEKELKIAP